MSTITGSQERVGLRPAIQIGDIVALIGSLIIVIGYAVLPLATNYAPGATGAAFTDQRTTFLVLTLIAGAVGILSVGVGVLALRERGLRWWYFGLGALGLIFFVDNTLLHPRFLESATSHSVGIWKIILDSGGLLMLVGSVLLVAQAALPRRDEATTDRSSDTILGLIRVLVATLWFTQLLWKLPWANYGCPAGELVPRPDATGLCDWIGREIREPRYNLYLDFLNGFVSPNLGWMAFLIVGSEAVMAFSLMTGAFTRLGALAGLAMGINLFIGLTAVRRPYEWDWTYLMLPALNAVFVAIGGRWVGLDALLHPRLRRMAEARRGGLGGLVARALAWATS